jgi:hypothetical protein
MKFPFILKLIFSLFSKLPEIEKFVFTNFGIDKVFIFVKLFFNSTLIVFEKVPLIISIELFPLFKFTKPANFPSLSEIVF